MLALTRRTEYALIAVCHLARVGPRVVSAREIAERYSVPLPLLMNVLKALCHQGFVQSVRGARGGYRLAQPASSISLAVFIEAVEGPLRLVRCTAPADDGEEPCELVEDCPIRNPVQKLHDRLRGFLDGITVDELATERKYVSLQLSGPGPESRTSASRLPGVPRSAGLLAEVRGRADVGGEVRG